MFTGIIEEVGVIKALALLGDGRSMRLSILAKGILADMKVGDSVSVNGCCLTVSEFSSSEMSMDISPETLKVTTLGTAQVGDGVNLECSLQVGGRLGGHWVSGHVDGVGRILDRQAVSDAVSIRIEAPRPVLRYCVKKGSIAVDGISLTINELSEKDFSVMIIPHTAKATTLGVKGIGSEVNLESDILGKYVERLLSQPETSTAKIDLDYMKRHDLI